MDSLCKVLIYGECCRLANFKCTDTFVLRLAMYGHRERFADFTITDITAG